jgi:hypothetical protein
VHVINDLLSSKDALVTDAAFVVDVEGLKVPRQIGLLSRVVGTAGAAQSEGRRGGGRGGWNKKETDG